MGKTESQVNKSLHVNLLDVLQYRGCSNKFMFLISEIYGSMMYRDVRKGN